MMDSRCPIIPFWLFSRSALEYGRGLLRLQVLTEIPRRIVYLL